MGPRKAGATAMEKVFTHPAVTQRIGGATSSTVDLLTQLVFATATKGGLAKNAK